MKKLKTEIITASFILCISLVVRFVLIPRYVDTEESYDLASLSPAFFPSVATWIIAGLAILLLVTIIRSKRYPEKEPEFEPLSSSERQKVLFCFVVLVVYLFALQYLGFLISTILLLGALFISQGIRDIFRLAFLSASVTLVVYVSFLLLDVHLPGGLFFH